jgi:hypothetical protein
MHFWLLLTFIISFFSGWGSVARQLDLVRILSPNDSSILKGVISIRGTVTGVGLQRGEISFRYEGEDSSNWFLIDQVNESVVDNTIANWDTANIADGTYQLKVVAFYDDGHQIESIINNLQIRNYTAVETPNRPTKETTISGSTAIPPTSSPTKTVKIATPTLLAPNDLALTSDDIVSSIVQGAIIGVLSILIISVWLYIRHRNLR